MRGRRPGAASWALSLLAALALAVGAVLAYAEHTAFRAEAFADVLSTSLQRAPVRDAAARRLTDAAIGARPNLVAVRPILQQGAQLVVGTPAFRSLVRHAARNAHRSAFGRRSDTPALVVLDAGLLLGDTVRLLAPGLSARVPTGLRVQVGRVSGGVNRLLLRLAERAERARTLRPIAFILAGLFAIAAIAITDSRRASVLRLGVALALASTVVGLLSALVPVAAAARVSGPDGDAVRSVLSTWLRPVTVWSVAAGALGLVLALAAASVVRRVPVVPALRRVRSAATAAPRGPRERAARIALTMGLGAALIASPRGMLVLVAVAVGAVIVVVAVSELFALVAGPAPVTGGIRRPSASRAARVAAVVVVLAVVAAGASVLSSDDPAARPRLGRCNGQAALCERRLDEVAFLGTHNSMAADREPGWLFAAQDAGIPSQLDDGVRALLIDTHYGFQRRRGVVTDLSGQTKSRGKLVDELGEPFVTTAERLRARLGPPRPGAQRKVFLCHAFCEVGATDAVTALAGVHRFLVTHPEEVILLSIEDDTEPADTAAIIRRSGLADEVYEGPASAPWPTLRELIDRDERVVVVVENRPGREPWTHLQRSVFQETPYRFKAVEELAAAASCDANRGGTEGSLFLVNHWVDTTPAPRRTIAKDVNASAFLTRRLQRCRSVRNKTPTILALDFYATGDGQRVVDDLNRR